jgi:serine/threonine protein kinase
MATAHYVREIIDRQEDTVDVQVDVQSASDVFDLVNKRLASTEDLAAGVRISPNIRLVSLLRTGGMANVWIAEHAGLGTQVAVKFMSGELVSNPECLGRFATEAKIAARIKSPHVVNIFDYATTPAGLPYIVMELLEGEDLEMRIRGGRTLSFEDSSRVLVQICKALAKAHGLGIVHRDIKPENVFLFEHEGEIFVKVLDFGIAKDETKMQSVTVAGTTMGTPSFMSPEQIFRPNDVDHRSDLWSTAVVAYRCLTGALPFDGDTLGAMCLSVRTGKFAAPSSIDPTLPRALDSWFEKALSLDPAVRFQSASDMANAYLVELEKAQCLPSWAFARESTGGRTSYTSDPGGLSGASVMVRPARRLDARTLVIALLVAALSVLATSPQRSALFALIGAPASDMPLLNPPPDDPPLVFGDPWPRALARASPPAVVKRSGAREVTPSLLGPRKSAPRNRSDVPTTPSTSTARRGQPTSIPLNDQFGI